MLAQRALAKKSRYFQTLFYSSTRTCRNNYIASLSRKAHRSRLPVLNLIAHERQQKYFVCDDATALQIVTT
jgi:hypothetical protein